MFQFCHTQIQLVYFIILYHIYTGKPISNSLLNTVVKTSFLNWMCTGRKQDQRGIRFFRPEYTCCVSLLKMSSFLIFTGFWFCFGLFFGVWLVGWFLFCSKRNHLVLNKNFAFYITFNPSSQNPYKIVCQNLHTIKRNQLWLFMFIRNTGN